MTNFPNYIKFLSDDTEVELVREIINPKMKERAAVYVFTKAGVNEGKEFAMYLAQIEKLLSENLIEVK